MELEVQPDAIREGLATFSGVDRRFQLRGKERGVSVVDDYGHHPTEIQATLDGARLCGFRRIHVLFQPHRYTRTQHLMDEFARAFHQADSLFVMDIYAASETPIEGVTAEALVDRIRQFGHRGAEYVGTMDRGVDAVTRAAGEGDLVLTLGAGSVTQAPEKILERLRQETPRQETPRAGGEN
jgi:UDP-N-acetylmuramate--alanine ligase